MTFYANDVHPIPPDHCAPDCDDQLPLISRVGRGIKGDGFYVRVTDPDSTTMTKLEGLSYDEASKEWHSEWISENINGGELQYQYNLRPYTIPRTFTITFIYRRPERDEWSWTTPAIPYIWTMDNDGETIEKPDHIVGSGVATLFIRASKTDMWNERLKYPEGTTREDFNAPEADEAWAATITFGHGGDIEIPNFDDLAKIIGVTVEQINQILEGNTIKINGIDAKNLIEYIDGCDSRDLEHVHTDLGFGDSTLKADNPHGYTVKEYIDYKVNMIINGDKDHKGIIQQILEKIVGGEDNVVDPETGEITWKYDGQIAIGNINLYSNATDNDEQTAVIRCHDGGKDYDVQVK